MFASPEELVALGQAIRKARRDRDLSQEALADRAGLNAKHVGEIERARKDPRFTTVLKLARALELPLNQLSLLYEARLKAGAPTRQ